MIITLKSALPSEKYLLVKDTIDCEIRKLGHDSPLYCGAQRDVLINTHQIKIILDDQLLPMQVLDHSKAQQSSLFAQQLHTFP